MIILALIAVSALFMATRLYKLDIVPFGAHKMHIDELGAAYDAFCVSEYGVDQFLYRMPVYTKCFGESQDVLYTYLAAIIFKIGGISIFNFRLVAVICAMGAFAALYCLIRDISTPLYSVVGLALMTVMPVYMLSQHWGLQCNLLMSFVIISMYFHVHAVITDKPLYYFLAGLFWGITLYTYVMAYIIVPVFLLLSLAVLIIYKKLDIKKVLLVGIPLLVLGVPLLIQQLVMMGYIEPFSFMGVVDFWRPDHYRGGEISASYVLENLIDSLKYTYVADRSRYDANPLYGTMYYVSIPFILIGMVSSATAVVRDVKDHVLNPWMFNWLYFLTARIYHLFLKYPNINRINGIYPAYLLFTVYGIKSSAEFIEKKKPSAVKAFYALLIIAYAIPFVAFSKYFYTYSGLQSDAYDIGDSLGCDVEAAEAAALAKKIASKKPVIAMLNDGWQRHLALALYTETSPYDFFRDNEPQDRSFNGVEWRMPDGLDLSGDTVYLIDAELIHITQYLQSEGFAVDITYPDFTVVYKNGPDQ